MRRLLVLLCALSLLAWAAPAAHAQAPTPTPTVAAGDPAGDPGDDVLDPDEIPPESTPEPTTPCSEDDAGADGEYAPCAPCSATGTDGDYTYCEEAAGSAGPPPRPAPTAAVQPLAARQLPYTGSDAPLIALLGTGLLLAGAGLRLRLRPAGRSPSA
jgi:LPXTG-motif cell wall-anchored protein